jgi:2,4-dienoyl-CoA reductase-like NADH-dependent reductase (Old Yellow Enzyme family)
MKTKLVIKNKKLNNPYILAPMCQYMGKNGKPTEWHYQHLGKAIIAGFSKIMIESTAVSSEGRITTKDLCLYKKSHMIGLKKLLNYLKKLNNVPVGIQLSHSGRKGSSQVPWIKHNRPLKKNKWKTISPSEIRKDKGWPMPKKIGKAKIKILEKNFLNSAKMALKAGFDCIEIHMAHGYLLHQFFSPISNKRNDIYGGNLENRCRFLLEIAKQIANICKNKKIILGARITGKDWVKGGIDLKDSIYLSNKLKKLGFDYVCVSSGGIKTTTNLNVKSKFNVNIAKKIKLKSSILTRVAGNIKNISDAKKIIKKKNADLVAFARPFLNNPNFLFKEKTKVDKNINIPKPYLRGFIT